MSTMREVLCNTSPLLYLHQLGRLDLLPALYTRITIPAAVAFELHEGGRLGHAVPNVEALAWIAIEKVEHAAILRLATDLDAGEREVSEPTWSYRRKQTCGTQVGSLGLTQWVLTILTRSWWICSTCFPF
jgi:hypothetical protein